MSGVSSHREVRTADPSTGQSVQRCWLKTAQTLEWLLPSLLADLSQVLTAGKISKTPRKNSMWDPTQWEFLDTDTPRILGGRICWLINTTWNTHLKFLETVWCFHVNQFLDCRRRQHRSKVAVCLCNGGSRSLVQYCLVGFSVFLSFFIATIKKAICSVYQMS